MGEVDSFAKHMRAVILLALASGVSASCYAFPKLDAVCLARYVKDQSCGFANQWGTSSNRVAWLNKEWWALEEDKRALLTSDGKAALRASTLSTEGSPMSFVYMEGTAIKAIIGKVVDGTYTAHYAMCKN